MSSVTLRHHAWLLICFSTDVHAALIDLPFHSGHLFGNKADSALEKFKASEAIAKSLNLQQQKPQKNYRQLVIQISHLLNIPQASDWSWKHFSSTLVLR